MGVRADSGDRRFQPGDISGERRSLGGDLSLERAIRERRRQAALPFDLLKDPPGLVAERSGQRLERAGAGGGVGDKSEVGFAQEDELGVAREASRETVRKAGGERMRQDAHAVSAAEAGRERSRRPAHDVHIWIAGRHRAPGALRLHMHRARLEAASLLDARPRDTQRAEFRQCRQFIRVRRQPERDQPARFVKRQARPFKQPQQADCGGKRKAKLLRRTPAGRMDRAGVGDQERPAEALPPQVKRRLEARRRLSAPIGRKWPTGRTGERIEPERDRAVFRFRARAFDQGAKAERLAGAVGPKIELEMRARVEAARRQRLCEARRNRIA